MDEALEEIALRGLGGAPGQLELLVRLKVGALAHQLQPRLETVRDHARILAPMRFAPVRNPGALGASP
jgi:hypothetical protein